MRILPRHGHIEILKMTKTKQIFELTAPYNNPYQGKYHRALFVCSAGLLRSATAATIGTQLGMNTRSCGSSPYALIPISANLIAWADTIYFVNQDNYNQVMLDFYGQVGSLMQLEVKSVVWDIEDDYEYMHPELVAKIHRELKA